MLLVKKPGSALARRALLGSLLAAAVTPALAAAQTPGAVSKTPIDFTIGPSGNASPSWAPEMRIAGATIHEDRAAATGQATVTLSGTAPITYDAQLRIAFGVSSGPGACSWDGDGAVHYLVQLRTLEAIYVLANRPDQRGAITATAAGNVVTVTSPKLPGVFDGRGFRCARVSTEEITTDGYAGIDYSTSLGFAPEEPVVVNAVPVGTPGSTAVILDADGDGIHDGIDKCPKLAGAGTDGCETTPAARSVKLGTKRVVVDRLLPLTEKACPASVTAYVSAGHKRLAKQRLGVTAHGKYCQVVGVVKLKVKAKKAKVVIKGTGVTAASVNVTK